VSVGLLSDEEQIPSEYCREEVVQNAATRFAAEIGEIEVSCKERSGLSIRQLSYMFWVVFEKARFSQ
jgi:hypothetical protein